MVELILAQAQSWASNPMGDFMNVQGELYIGTGVNVEVSGHGGEYHLGEVFQLMDFGSLRADSQLMQFSLPDISTLGLSWNTSYFNKLGVIAVVAIPEPSRLLLLGAALVAVFGVRRR